MAIIDLFSRRKKRSTEGEVDVFTYADIPGPLRVQIVHIWDDSFGEMDGFQSHTREIYENMHKALAREFGMFSLGKEYQSDYESLANYFLRVQETDKVLDIIELTFRFIELLASNENFKYRSNPRVTAQEAISELNTRFLQHAVGYEFVSGHLIQKDREVLHREVVLPALQLLHDRAFSGANQEYLNAHAHYRNGKYKECLNDCLKAFESTMKVICRNKGWKYDQNATAKALIEVCFKNNLIPSFLQSEISAIRSSLESGIPTVRNKLSGHGQGETPIEVPGYYASYLLHLTASTIVFLADAAEK